MKQSSFYFIRHGETDWNRENRTMGQKDIPLNNVGRLQAKRAVNLLKSCNIKTICHSPLHRAKETAIILNEFLQCSLIEVDFLKECNWGILDSNHNNAPNCLPFHFSLLETHRWINRPLNQEFDLEAFET